MGYYSEVLVVIPNVYLEEFKSKAAERFKKIDGSSSEYNFIIDAIQEDYAENCFILHYESVKWYDSFDEVQFIENFCHEHYSHFLRVGEESGDIEDETYCYTEDVDANPEWVGSTSCSIYF